MKSNGPKKERPHAKKRGERMSVKRGRQSHTKKKGRVKKEYKRP